MGRGGVTVGQEVEVKNKLTFQIQTAIQYAPLICSEEAVVPLVVKSINWIEDISVSIFSTWVVRLAKQGL